MIQLYREIKENNLDTNDTDTKTAGVDVKTCSQLTFYVIKNTGTHVNNIVTLQFSPENVDESYQDSQYTIRGSGCLHVSDIESVAWVRLKVTTAEGGTSTSDLAIDPSRDVKRFC